MEFCENIFKDYQGHQNRHQKIFFMLSFFKDMLRTPRPNFVQLSRPVWWNIFNSLFLKDCQSNRQLIFKEFFEGAIKFGVVLDYFLRTIRVIIVGIIRFFQVRVFKDFKAKIVDIFCTTSKANVMVFKHIFWRIIRTIKSWVLENIFERLSEPLNLEFC